MGRQRQVYQPFRWVFPSDFPERLERFKEESGLSWRAIARLLGVSLHRLRQWRNKGVAPGHANLFLLLTIAGAMGLRDGILMCQELDLPEGFDPEAYRR